MNKTFLQALIPVSLILALSACSDSTPISRLQVQYMTTNAAPIMKTDTKAQAQLAQASASIDQSAQQDASIQLATHPEAKVAPGLDPATTHMTQISSLNWYGPLQPLLAKIAVTAGYQLRVLGNEPATPILIVINAQQQPLATILQNTIYQAAGKANVNVYPSTKIIELRYPVSP